MATFKYYHLLFITFFIAAASAQLMICPQVCSCIWRNGKQTTICENQNLISIPNQISPSTQVLDLNTNNFQILPSRAFQERGLINLQKLFLPRCKLGAIADDAFVQLTNLVELDLSENLLTTVPVKALANTTNLRRLLLNGNHIATISAEAFAPLTSLKFLNLSGTISIFDFYFYPLRSGHRSKMAATALCLPFLSILISISVSFFRLPDAHHRSTGLLGSGRPRVPLPALEPTHNPAVRRRPGPARPLLL